MPPATLRQITVALETCEPPTGSPELDVRASDTEGEFRYANGDVYHGTFARCDGFALTVALDPFRRHLAGLGNMAFDLVNTARVKAEQDPPPPTLGEGREPDTGALPERGGLCGKV